MLRPLDFKTAIMLMVWQDESLKADQIADWLDRLDLPVPTSFCINSIKQRFRADLRFLRDQGLLSDDPSHDLIRKPKSKKEERPLRRHFYAKDHD